MQQSRFALSLAAMVAVGAGIGWFKPARSPAVSAVAGRPGSVATVVPSDVEGRIVARFDICHTGGGRNCVVDGDTAWIDGTKVRIADIDAPETHPPRCQAEADLGERATLRLAELMNSGPFEMERYEGRDEDRFGRKLRVLARNGESIGGILVREGLARRYGGGRRPWC